jgi:hypothetical protein
MHARNEEKGGIENGEWKRRERLTDSKRGERWEQIAENKGER